jgi:predicted nucleic acid-binding protein
MAEEEDTGLVRRWLEDDTAVVTWVWTRVELVGAIERRARQGAMSLGARRDLLLRADRLAEGWDEVTEVFAVRARALAVLARHDLRAADAAQLGAALLAAADDPASLTFVCLDERLAAIADREGLRVLTRVRPRG